MLAVIMRVWAMAASRSAAVSPGRPKYDECVWRFPSS